MSLSIREQIQRKPKVEQQRWIEAQPTELVRELSRKPWWYIGRPEQQEPEGDWLIWLILSGRGWGKTRTGGEWLAKQIIEQETK